MERVDGSSVVMIGPFGMWPRTTMRERALPMAEALVARGYQVTIILPPWQTPDDSGRCWEVSGVRVENVRLPHEVLGLSHGLTAWRMGRRALALRPDVIHLFKPKAYSGLSHWLLKRTSLQGRPRLVVDTDDWEGPGGWNELAEYTAIQRRFFAWQERWGLTHADAVTVASRALETLVWALGVPRDHVFYVPNGVGRKTGSETRTARTDRPCLLLYTRFFEFAVSRVLEVFRGVRARMPEAQLLVVGQGLFGEEEELFSLAEEAGLTTDRLPPSAGDGLPGPALRAGLPAQDVVFAGWVPPEALPAFFGMATVAIYPFDDTLVNRAKCAAKLRDLLAAGLPVVADSVGQNPEYIRQGETGLLVSPGDVPSFVDAVVCLLQNEALRSRLGQAASQDMRERFAWDRLVHTVERAYGLRT